MNTPSPTDTDHHTAILNAAVESFGRLGYYGTPLQRIVAEMGLAETNVLYYVGSKKGPLKLALTEECDRATESINATTVTRERPLIADMWHQVVAASNERLALVRIFSTLSTEALDPAHPAHDYFADREHRTVAMAFNINWVVPEGVNVEHMLRAGFSMMDGLQLRWLRTPGQNLNTM